MPPGAFPPVPSNSTALNVTEALGITSHFARAFGLEDFDFISKPFDKAEVLARIRALLRRKSPDIQGSTLTAGDLRMDVLTRKVRRGERDIALTNKEFEVLEYLLRSKGRVLSRVLLTERIWDMNFDSDTNVVDVAVRRLRTKVDDPFPQKLVHTVRGVGYVLEER